MGLKTASVIFPTCAEYYDSIRADQLLLERRHNNPQTSTRCRLLADTVHAVDAASHVLGTAAQAHEQHPVTAASYRARVDMDRAWLSFVFFVCFFP
jgi:hypothetical protein